MDRCTDCGAALLAGERDRCDQCEARGGVYFAGSLIAILILIAAILAIWLSAPQSVSKERPEDVTGPRDSVTPSGASMDRREGDR